MSSFFFRRQKEHKNLRCENHQMVASYYTIWGFQTTQHISNREANHSETKNVFLFLATIFFCTQTKTKPVVYGAWTHNRSSHVAKATTIKYNSFDIISNIKFLWRLRSLVLFSSRVSVYCERNAVYASRLGAVRVSNGIAVRMYDNIEARTVLRSSK